MLSGKGVYRARNGVTAMSQGQGTNTGDERTIRRDWCI